MDKQYQIIIQPEAEQGIKQAYYWMSNDSPCPPMVRGDLPKYNLAIWLNDLFCLGDDVSKFEALYIYG